MEMLGRRQGRFCKEGSCTSLGAEATGIKEQGCLNRTSRWAHPCRLPWSGSENFFSFLFFFLALPFFDVVAIGHPLEVRGSCVVLFLQVESRWERALMKSMDDTGDGSLMTGEKAERGVF